MLGSPADASIQLDTERSPSGALEQAVSLRRKFYCSYHVVELIT
jgi:hypothetical protein